MKKLILFILCVPSICLAKHIIVKINDTPAYRIVDIQGMLNSPDYVCDAPTDPVKLQELIDAQSETDSLTVVPDATNPGGFRAIIDIVKQTARQAELDAARANEARQASVRIARIQKAQDLISKFDAGTDTTQDWKDGIKACLKEIRKDLD